MKHIGKALTGFILDIFETIFIGFVVFAFVYIFVGQLLRVTGDSMIPNFVDGEQIIAEKVSVKFGDLNHGEIVVFKSPVNSERLIIKRVIALPGDKITVSQGNVLLNGKLLEEPYLEDGTKTYPGKILEESREITVPADHYVFMGDNRSNSTDSREWGPISKDLVVAKGFLIYYPLDKFKLL